MCSMPWEKRYGLPSATTAIFSITNTTFGYFNKTDCGLRSVAIAPNPSQVDYSPPMTFNKISWVSIDHDARMWLSSFPRVTASECDKTCDSLNYLTAADLDGSFAGVANSVVVSDYNPSLAGDTSRCEARPQYGAYLCRFRLRAIVLDNMDGDRGGRRIGPVRITQQGPLLNLTTFSNGNQENEEEKTNTNSANSPLSLFVSDLILVMSTFYLFFMMTMTIPRSIRRHVSNPHVLWPVSLCPRACPDL
jgi:hypothetical protein